VAKIKQAIRPNPFTEFREVSTLKTEGKKDEQDLHLHSLSRHKGWKILTKFIDNLKDDLDNLIKLRMEAGATFDEIGQKMVIVSIAKEYLTKIQTKVNDAKEEIDNETPI
jgi:hypothetical protein